MEKESQDKYRAALIEKYEQRAFECLALYGYYGQEYQNIEKQLKEMESRSKEFAGQIARIREFPDGKSKESRNKISMLQKDIDDYTKRIQGVSEPANKLFERTGSYREEGVRILEQIEHFKAFNLKTPAQIEADKNQTNDPSKAIS